MRRPDAELKLNVPSCGRQLVDHVDGGALGQQRPDDLGFPAAQRHVLSAQRAVNTEAHQQRPVGLELEVQVGRAVHHGAVERVVDPRHDRGL